MHCSTGHTHIFCHCFLSSGWESSFRCSVDSLSYRSLAWIQKPKHLNIIAKTLSFLSGEIWFILKSQNNKFWNQRKHWHSRQLSAPWGCWGCPELGLGCTGEEWKLSDSQLVSLVFHISLCLTSWLQTTEIWIDPVGTGPLVLEIKQYNVHVSNFQFFKLYVNKIWCQTFKIYIHIIFLPSTSVVALCTLIRDSKMSLAVNLITCKQYQLFVL